MFGIGAQEMVFLAVIALLVFGPKRLPELARTVGRGLAEFRRASSDLRGAFSLEPDPPGTPKKRKNVDPREDREFDTPAPQSALHQSIIDEVKAAEAAVAAELADEANDEKHRDEGEAPTSSEETASGGDSDAEAKADDEADDSSADAPPPPTTAAQAPAHDGPPGTVPTKASSPRRRD